MADFLCDFGQAAYAYWGIYKAFAASEYFL